MCLINLLDGGRRLKCLINLLCGGRCLQYLINLSSRSRWLKCIINLLCRGQWLQCLHLLVLSSVVVTFYFSCSEVGGCNVLLLFFRGRWLQCLSSLVQKSLIAMTSSSYTKVRVATEPRAIFYSGVNNVVPGGCRFTVSDLTQGNVGLS